MGNAQRLKLAIAATPGARTTEAAGAYGDALRDGKANAALIAWAAQAFGLPRADVHLLHGAAGRRKVLELDFPDAAALHTAQEQIAAWMNAKH